MQGSQCTPRAPSAGSVPGRRAPESPGAWQGDPGPWSGGAPLPGGPTAGRALPARCQYPTACSVQSRRVMVGQQLGLRRDRVGGSGFQHLRNLLVVHTPRAVEQRLIRRILDQRVLEEVGGLWQSTLVEQLRCHQLTQPLLERRVAPRGHGPQQLVEKSRPSVAPSCASPASPPR